MRVNFCASLIIFLFFCSHSYTQQVINGTVQDRNTSKPISEAIIVCQDIGKRVVTDDDGTFSFISAKRKIIHLHVAAEDYQTCDTAIRVDFDSGIVNISVKLTLFESTTDTIDVNSVFYKKGDDIHTANTYAVYEELRKTPGTVEDIIKYFQNSIGVTFASDADNDLLVRGGSPIENLTTLDGIEILNPNHYGPPGSTSGALSFINLKLVDEVNFYAGGFPVKYGDRMSSVMNIRLKEGDKKRHWRDLNLSVTGFGGFFEGPISEKMNYMISVRRSYMEILRKDLNFQYLPNYWDLNLKLGYDINKTDKISYIGLFAYDRANYYDPVKDSIYKSTTPVDLKLLSTGFNYTQDRKSHLFSFILSENYSFYHANLHGFNIGIYDNQLKLSGEYKKPLAKNLKIDMTGEFRYVLSNYDVYSRSYISPTGFFVPTILYHADVNTFRAGVSADIIAEPVKNRITFNAGVRFDYSEIMQKGFSISPRAGASFRIFPVTTLNLNIGLYTQQPEYLWLLSGDNKKRLDNIKLTEAIVGIEHFFAADLRVNLEGYVKYYNNYPVSLYDPYYIFINMSGIYPSFLGDAQSTGFGYYNGIDLTIEHKNRGNGLYGTLNLSLARSSFKATYGGYQPGDFEHRYQLQVIAGYRFPFDLIISGRVKYTDGVPYSPYDEQYSYMIGQGMYDMSRYASLRTPDYLRFDFRIDKFFKFWNTQLILYFEVWNVFNRHNVYAYYFWSGPSYHWGRVPVLGFSYRF